MNLKKVEALFNELFDFDNLLKDATQYIEKILLESDTNFLAEDVTDETHSFKELKVEYNRTHLLINNLGSMPSFRLEFYLYEYGDELPKYTYEIEYNSSGEFLDEYFLEY
ncbi:hypothetical protein [Clostridium taeniosporum]|uniref:Uncharacterized protein n=1 Tax=Clostridium taeniosporum TaxID=394958 RepID=A0A1D7XNU9_9CLOT|nr:hypothetical protein [Clostridium taeniosporum]AOR25008.1 hypothetical protein BGI42_14775 [Clostridium taeniosporum]